MPALVIPKLHFEKRVFFIHQLNTHTHIWASLVAQTVKNLPAMQKTRVWSLSWEDPLQKGMATHSSILVWRIPWLEESGELQSMGLQRVRRDWVPNTHTHTCVYLWLCSVLVVARAIFLASWEIFRGGTGLSTCGACIFSCFEACGILVPQSGTEPTSSALQGRFLTPGPPGKSKFTNQLFVEHQLYARPCVECRETNMNERGA